MSYLKLSGKMVNTSSPRVATDGYRHAIHDMPLLQMNIQMHQQHLSGQIGELKEAFATPVIAGTLHEFGEKRFIITLNEPIPV